MTSKRVEVCSVFCLAATRNKICYQTQQGLKRKISRLVFKFFPGKFFALSKYSPVNLHFSPDTAILNETPAVYRRELNWVPSCFSS